jgi:Rieske Fe-S protein
MDRRKFIKTGCISCLGGGMMMAVLQSCGTTKIMNAAIKDDDMLVPLNSFEIKKGNNKEFKKYLVVQNDILQYPICIYRFDENSYEALWMRCTHQGTELQVFGDKLQCPAHGSEFNSHGKAENGPASSALRTFPITIDGNQLKISLK